MIDAYAGKRVLITGGLGMIGSTLAHRLVAAGAEVLLVDALLPLYGGNRFNIAGLEDRARVNICDIRDAAAIDVLVRGQDYVFDLAAQVSHNDSLTDPYLDLDINCRGHLVVLEALRRFNPGACYVHPGSRLQYGRIERNPVTEDHPQVPLSLYGVHKQAAELYCLAYHRHWGLDTVCLRITNPYGPRAQMKHSRYTILNWFIRQAMEGRPLKVFGDGHQLRDYIYVDDLADGMLAAAATKACSGQVYNIGSGRAERFADMVETVVRVVGRGRVDYVPWPRDYENVETGDFGVDVGKLRAATGWAPRVDLEDGIRRTHAYYEAHRDRYFDEPSS